MQVFYGKRCIYGWNRLLRSLPDLLIVVHKNLRNLTSCRITLRSQCPAAHAVEIILQQHVVDGFAIPLTRIRVAECFARAIGAVAVGFCAALSALTYKSVFP